MTKWVRGGAFIAIMMAAVLAGATFANVQQPVAAAKEIVAPEAQHEPVDAVAEQQEETPPSVESEVALTPESESDDETDVQEDLFLPYPIPKVDRSQVFGWIEELLGYLDADGRTELVATWQTLARHIEEEPNIVWDELVDDLGSVGADWLSEQLDWVKIVRNEVRSSLDHLREETMDVIQEHLKTVEETEAADVDAETAAE